ncbi:MAG: sigma-70 family RNA polymerase sigma factor [Planctomycetaceae bacterium]
MTDGEPLDWDQIVELNAQRVLRVSLRILGSVQDAEDVSQDVFAEAFRLKKTTNIQNWEAFLVRLATLRSLDCLRRRHSFVELRIDDRISSIEPADELAARELADWLRTSISDLPDQQAAVFAMTYFEQLSRDDISEALSISPEAVSTALYKARQDLLSQLAVFHRGENK